MQTRIRLWIGVLGIVLLRSFPLAAQATAAAPASTGPALSGPMDGFVFDLPSRSIRAISGLVGSSSFGPVMVRDVDYASVAPRKDYAFVLRGEGGMFVSGLSSSATTTLTLPSTVLRPEGSVWSGDGSAAILYSRAGNWIQAVTGLPGAATPAPSIDLTPFGGALSVVAADSPGRQIAIGMVGNSGGVYAMSPAHGFTQVLSITKPVALAFSADGLTLYALDGATAQVSQVSLADFTSQSFPLGGLLDPIGMAIAPNGVGRQAIYVAGARDRMLQVYDAASGALLTALPLGFQPSTIDVLGNNSYVLGPRASVSNPLWSFRAAPVPAVYFVPAAPLTLPEDRRR
jgi:hypothetical protein